MFLLDTDIATLAFHNHPMVLERIGRADRPVCMPLPTRLELLRGRIESVLKAANEQNLLRAEELLARTESFCSGFTIIGIGSEAAKTFVRLLGDKKLKRIGRGDLLNSSVCLALGATLVTRNLKDYRSVPGLLIEDWTG